MWLVFTLQPEDLHPLLNAWVWVLITSRRNRFNHGFRKRIRGTHLAPPDLESAVDTSHLLLRDSTQDRLVSLQETPRIASADPVTKAAKPPQSDYFGCPRRTRPGWSGIFLRWKLLGDLG